MSFVALVFAQGIVRDRSATEDLSSQRCIDLAMERQTSPGVPANNLQAVQLLVRCQPRDESFASQYGICFIVFCLFDSKDSSSLAQDFFAVSQLLAVILEFLKVCRFTWVRSQECRPSHANFDESSQKSLCISAN